MCSESLEKVNELFRRPQSAFAHIFFSYPDKKETNRQMAMKTLLLLKDSDVL